MVPILGRIFAFKAMTDQAARRINPTSSVVDLFLIDWRSTIRVPLDLAFLVNSRTFVSGNQYKDQDAATSEKGRAFCVEAGAREHQ